MRGEWIEIFLRLYDLTVGMSLPMRGEWIEIGFETVNITPAGRVSPHAGRVD